MPKMRCQGSGHSWTPFFADDGSWAIDTRGLNDICWSADNPTQVTLTLSTAFLRRRCRGLYICVSGVFGCPIVFVLL